MMRVQSARQMLPSHLLTPSGDTSSLMEHDVPKLEPHTDHVQYTAFRPYSARLMPSENAPHTMRWWRPLYALITTPFGLGVASFLLASGVLLR
jgi:hypothetical protein